METKMETEAYDELTTTELREIYEQECRAQGLDPAEQADACLSSGREFLPPAALAVLDGEEPSSDYWDWLHTQVVAQLPESHWMPTHLNGGLSG